MESEFWHQRWASNQIGFHEGQVNAYLARHYADLGLAPGETVFVPLCGKSVDLRWLADQGAHVVGVELSPIAVESFFAEQGLTPRTRKEAAFTVWESGPIRLLCGDYFALTPAHLAGVHAVYDRTALIALPPERRADYIAHLDRLLPGARRTLLITLEYPQEQMQGPPSRWRSVRCTDCSPVGASSGWASRMCWPTIHVSVRRGSRVCWNTPTASSRTVHRMLGRGIEDR